MEVFNRSAFLTVSSLIYLFEFSATIKLHIEMCVWYTKNIDIVGAVALCLKN